MRSTAFNVKGNENVVVEVSGTLSRCFAVLDAREVRSGEDILSNTSLVDLLPGKAVSGSSSGDITVEVGDVSGSSVTRVKVDAVDTNLGSVHVIADGCVDSAGLPLLDGRGGSFEIAVTVLGDSVDDTDGEEGEEREDDE